MALQKYDRVVPRTPSDIERKYRMKKIAETSEEVEKLKEDFTVDTVLSSSSTNPIANKVVTEALANKVTKENGKGLSTNDFTDDYVSKVNKSAQNNHTHSNKSALDKITEDSINTWNKIGVAYPYDMSKYAESGVTILRSSCIEKDNRVCINFVGTKTMNANTTTTLFTLPTDIRPSVTRDFVAFGQSSNNDGYVGYGYITADGLLQVRFNIAISSYIRFTVTYDK